MLPAAWEHVQADEVDLATELFDTPDEAQEWLASAVPLLETYFRLEDPTTLEPAERELRVETTLDDGLVLRGFVDRLDRNAAGDTRVVDYKTGKAPGEGYEQKALFQMRFYALVLWRATGVVPRLLQLLYLGNEQVLRLLPRRRRAARHRAQGQGAVGRDPAGARDRRLAAVAVAAVRLVRPQVALPGVRRHAAAAPRPGRPRPRALGTAAAGATPAG